MIRRRITAQNNSHWQINGKNAIERDVHNLVSSLNIQLENKCQFLPQDIVPEFVRMNPAQLLKSTEEAVGGPKMLKQHEELEKLGKNYKESMVGGRVGRSTPAGPLGFAPLQLTIPLLPRTRSMPSRRTSRR